MPSKNKSSRQGRQASRAALKKLKAAGLYTGKLPRGKPSEYQQRIIRKFDDVVKGRAAVVKPKDPKSYKTIFQVAGDKVIVPKGKGEKIKLSKSGLIQRERKGPRGEKIVGTFRRMKPTERPAPEAPAERFQYAIPFARKLGKNRYRLEWKRFPTRESLDAFMMEYERTGRYEDWRGFVFQESLRDTRSQAERDAALNEAAVKYGKAQSTNVFEGTETLEPIMRVARKARRNQRWRRRGR